MSALSPVLAVASVLLAQAATPAPAPYRVGPGDVLEVSVDGRPDLARLPTVQTSGAVFLPGAGDVQVRGLTTDEIAERVAEALGPAGGATPRVAVRVRDYQSQFVWVRGAVNRTGRTPLRAGTRLVDALLDAGGFAPTASGRLTVERTTGALPDGSRRRVVRLAGGSPSAEELAELSLPLLAGDTITAEVQTWVHVSAGVARPGRYPFEDGLTLGRLVVAAGGRSGSARVVVRRAAGDVEADLDAIRDGRAADLPLTAGDEVTARTRRR
jgi:polysaccharide export outer membrane protein